MKAPISSEKAVAKAAAEAALRAASAFWRKSASSRWISAIAS
jgi:hypothetical protein